MTLVAAAEKKLCGMQYSNGNNLTAGSEEANIMHHGSKEDCFLCSRKR
jgi:hypothetical protein